MQYKTKAMILYYSGCGNSRFVAEKIAEGTGEKAEYIPALMDAGVSSFDCEGSSLGFVFPVYAWDVPKLVETFIRKCSWNGRPQYVWFACTCGDNVGKTCESFRKLMADKGLTLDAGFCFQMPETYLCFPGFKLDTDRNAEKKITGVKEKLPSVIEAIRNRAKVEEMIVGSMPGFKTHIIGPLFNLIVSDSGFHYTDDCIGCGTCFKVCPIHNISLVGVGEERRPRWNGNCTQCMACYHACPRNAIHYGKLTLGKGQYKGVSSVPDSSKEG